jgi:sulfhydrogenase subunit alpha
MARFNLNRDRLSPATRQLARRTASTAVTNPFESIVVRALETYQAFDEAIALIEDFPEPAQAAQRPMPAGGGVGMAATEAPRGLLFHRYEVDDDGLIRAPTSCRPRRRTSSPSRTICATWSRTTSTCRMTPDLALRAGDPQLRSLHLLRDPLSV